MAAVGQEPLQEEQEGTDQGFSAAAEEAVAEQQVLAEPVLLGLLLLLLLVGLVAEMVVMAVGQILLEILEVLLAAVEEVVVDSIRAEGEQGAVLVQMVK